MAKGRGKTGKVNFTAAFSSYRRTGGKSVEFGSKRNVNTGVSRGSSGDPNQKISGSAARQAPFNGSNVYGILARGSGRSGGSASGASRGNNVFGSGSAKSSGGVSTPRSRGRRGRR